MSQKIIFITILLIAGISALRINHQSLADEIPAGVLEKIKEFYSAFYPQADAAHEGFAENAKEYAAKIVEAAKQHPEAVEKVKSHLPHPKHDGFAENAKEYAAKIVEAAKQHPEAVEKVKSHLPHPHSNEASAHDGLKEVFESLPEQAQEQVAKVINNIKDHYPHPHSEEESTPSNQ